MLLQMARLRHGVSVGQQCSKQKKLFTRLFLFEFQHHFSDLSSRDWRPWPWRCEPERSPAYTTESPLSYKRCVHGACTPRTARRSLRTPHNTLHTTHRAPRAHGEKGRATLWWMLLPVDREWWWVLLSGDRWPRVPLRDPHMHLRCRLDFQTLQLAQ